MPATAPVTPLAGIAIGLLIAVILWWKRAHPRSGATSPATP
jgi:hypothetical protein